MTTIYTFAPFPISAFLSAGVLALSSATVAAQDVSICNAVLQNASQTSSTFNASTVSYFLAREACSRNFETYQRFSSWAGGGSASIPFAEALLGLSANAKNNDGVFRSEYQSACNKIVQSGQELFQSTQFTSIYTAQAYEAWNRCVSELAKAQSTFARVVMQGNDAKNFTITMSFSGRINFPVEVTSVSPGQSFMQCEYNGEKVQSGTKFDNWTVSLDCTKAPQNALTAEINTTAGSASSIQLPMWIGEPDDIVKLERKLRGDISALESRLSERLVPAGSVIAFAGSVCPSGWHQYTQLAGRVAVGVGNGPGLSSRVVGQTGGAERVTLTLAQIPAHTHGLYQDHNAGWGDHRERAYGPSSAHPATSSTGSAGGGTSHENMPPFLVMTMCEKL